MGIFIRDFPIIEQKINRHNERKVKELESEFRLNRCDTKGHLGALRSKCESILTDISVTKQVT